MPKFEKAIHLDAFMLYAQYGVMSQDFLREFESKFGKAESTAYRWAKEGNWKARAKEPIDKAVEELKEEQKINAKEVIIAFLDVAQNSMDAIETKEGYIDGIFGTAFERIPRPEKPKPENALVVDSIDDMERLVNMQVKLINAKQGWIKTVLLLAGKPDSHTEHSGSVNITQAIMNGNYYEES